MQPKPYERLPAGIDSTEFAENDFYVVSKFVDYFDIKITTPHILTEVSNLFGNRKSLQAALSKYIGLTKENFWKAKKSQIQKLFFSLVWLMRQFAKPPKIHIWL